MHGHQLSVNAHAILRERVQRLWQLDEGEGRLRVRVEVFFERIWSKVDVELVLICHDEEREGVESACNVCTFMEGRAAITLYDFVQFCRGYDELKPASSDWSISRKVSSILLPQNNSS